MFRTRILVVFVTILLTLSLNSWSHGGKLNPSQCHNYSKEKEYHCHKTPTKNQQPLKYSRANWQFRSSDSQASSSLLGWYTDTYSSATDVDHVVALHDAYNSGGHEWNTDEKKAFANDPLNHVTAIPYVNRVLKNSYSPLKFIFNISGSSYAFAPGRCLEYVHLYTRIKRRYALDFKNNRINEAIEACN